MEASHVADVASPALQSSPPGGEGQDQVLGVCSLSRSELLGAVGPDVDSELSARLGRGQGELQTQDRRKLSWPGTWAAGDQAKVAFSHSWEAQEVGKGEVGPKQDSRESRW